MSLPTLTAARKLNFSTKNPGKRGKREGLKHLKMNSPGSHFNFRLPILRRDSARRYRSSTSVTCMPWLLALNGHVEFVPWDGFGTLIRETLSELDAVDFNRLGDAKSFMESARNKVEPSCTVYPIPRSGITRSSNRDDSWDRLLPESCKNERSEITRALRCLDLPNGTDERPAFSDETSLQSLFGYIFDVIQDVLQHMTGTRLFVLRTKSLRLGKPTDYQSNKGRKRKSRRSVDSRIESAPIEDIARHKLPMRQQRTGDMTMISKKHHLGARQAVRKESLISLS